MRGCRVAGACGHIPLRVFGGLRDGSDVEDAVLGDGGSVCCADDAPDGCADDASYAQADEGAHHASYSCTDGCADEGTDGCADEGTYDGTDSSADGSCMRRRVAWLR